VRVRSAEAVPDLTDRIMASVARGSARPARWGGPVRPRRFLPAIAAAIAGLLVGSSLVGGSPPRTRADLDRITAHARRAVELARGDP